MHDKLNHRIEAKTRRTVSPRMVMAVLLVLVGMAIGAATSSLSDAHAEVRRSEQPESFKTGGQISVPILQDIAGTLHQINARMVRLEAAVNQIEAKIPTH